MPLLLKPPRAADLPIRLVDAAGVAAAPTAVRRWFDTIGFTGKPHQTAWVPGDDGAPAAVWLGVAAADDPWVLAALPSQLPSRRYRIDPAGLQVDPEAAARSWLLGAYRYTRYKAAAAAPPTLVLPSSPQALRGRQVADALMRVRDLVNTPAEDLGPADLAAAVRTVAAAHGARVKEVVGDALLTRGFPAIHAVGRAAASPRRAPRLIELNWGLPRHPRLTLVGKGVCFDSGGLDIKSADGMRLMKKDMGGAAHALALAGLVMARRLPVRLQLLIPAVENAIAGNAFRPGDVVRTRKGLAVEIGNTDAEGRVILCDALAYGAESDPALMIDLATLTGAARVALGPQLPALFCRDMAQARALVDLGLALQDPVWHLPLWRDYHAGIESPIADIVNTGRNAMAGAINAALFLEDFVPPATDWLHLDLFAWNDTARPGRPIGGEAQALRTLWRHLEQRFGA